MSDTPGEHPHPRAVLMFGMPGVGKGTQGALLGKVPGFVHLSSGDCFRALDRAGDLGRQVTELIDRGEFVPDDTTMRVVGAEIDGRVARGEFHPGSELLVLDGIPRTVRQAELIGDLAEILGVVYLVCNDVEAMVQRIKLRAAQGREDDADESIVRRRFDIFREETAPVLERFDSSLIREIDAMGTPAEVLGEVLRAVAPLQAGLIAR